MTIDEMDELARLCGNAAKELKEARQGFEAHFAENGLEHLREAMRYIGKLGEAKQRRKMKGLCRM